VPSNEKKIISYLHGDFCICFPRIYSYSLLLACRFNQNKCKIAFILYQIKISEFQGTRCIFISSTYINPYFEQAHFGDGDAQLFGITKIVLINNFLLDLVHVGAGHDGRLNR
jgi:hypothetical protein